MSFKREEGLSESHLESDVRCARFRDIEKLSIVNCTCRYLTFTDIVPVVGIISKQFYFSEAWIHH